MGAASSPDGGAPATIQLVDARPTATSVVIDTYQPSPREEDTDEARLLGIRWVIFAIWLTTWTGEYRRRATYSAGQIG